MDKYPEPPRGGLFLRIVGIFIAVAVSVWLWVFVVYPHGGADMGVGCVHLWE